MGFLRAQYSRSGHQAVSFAAVRDGKAEQPGERERHHAGGRLETKAGFAFNLLCMSWKTPGVLSPVSPPMLRGEVAEAVVLESRFTCGECNTLH